MTDRRTPRERRRIRVKRILRERNGYQFGQPNDTLVNGGTVACTDTCIQMIVRICKGKRVSLNKVRLASRAPRGQPMESDEALRALRWFGLPYELRTDLSASQITRIAMDRGPVIVCEAYWAHPQWHGYRYAGRRLSGWSTNGRGKRVKVGVARPRGRSGLTQWTFRGGHAVLLATGQVGGDGKKTAYIRDPNHNSFARPERPAWDRVTMGQLSRMLRSWPFGSRAVFVPTRRVLDV